MLTGRRNFLPKILLPKRGREGFKFSELSLETPGTPKLALFVDFGFEVPKITPLLLWC